MESEAVRALLLQQMLKRTAKLQSSSWHKYARAASRKPVGVQVACSGQRRKIDCVVQIDLRMCLESTAQHPSRAGIAWANSDGQDQWIRLQVSNPDRVEPFIKNAKGCQESSHRHRHPWVGDKVELHVFDFL